MSAVHRTVAPTASLSLMLALATGLSGCGSPEAPKSTPSADVGVTKTQQEILDACRTRLDGVVRRLNPDTLRAITRQNSTVGALNAWLVECAAEELSAFEVSEANLQFLPATARRAVSAPRYTERDAAYIRDSLIAARLAHGIRDRADAGGSVSETRRLVAVFRWVGRNISLHAGQKASPVAGFLDTLLTGRGSIRSRVWVFATLLRQLQYDAVILVPNADATITDDSDEFLIAVCLSDRILLFDPHTWLPVPGDGDESLLIDQPAGADFLAASDVWQQPGIRLIVETPAICPRLLVLQEQLPAEAAAMLYEEVAGGTSEIRPLVERVIEAAPEVLDASRLGWWTWPDEQVTAAAAPNQQQRRVHDAVMRPFEAPFERPPVELETDFTDLLSQPGLTQAQRENLWAQRWEMEYERMRKLEESGDAEKLFGRPSSRLLQTRLIQIEGSHDRSIIQQMQKIRNACLDDAITFQVPPWVRNAGTRSIPIPDAILQVNQMATGSALYWIGICQMDRDQPGTAITSFESYRRQYPNGVWFYPSIMNQAIAELAQGRTEAALESMKKADQDDNPDQPFVQSVIARLQKSVAPEPAAEPDENSSETTEQPSEDNSETSDSAADETTEEEASSEPDESDEESTDSEESSSKPSEEPAADEAEAPAP